MARVRQVEGDLDAASAHLDEAERTFDTDFGPEVRPIAALRARLWLAQGRVDDALAWAQLRTTYSSTAWSATDVSTST